MNMMLITPALVKLEVKVNGQDLAVFVSTWLRRHAELYASLQVLFTWVLDDGKWAILLHSIYGATAPSGP
jgi:hypothetical protein